MKIKLPQLEPESSLSIELALSNRETHRSYLNTPISIKHLSRLLFAAQGNRANSNKRCAPSAQEQYPISTYVLVNQVSDIAKGLYQYQSSDHALTEIAKGDFAKELEKTGIGEQSWIGDAAAVVILAGNISSLNHHFSEQPPLKKRGERYNYIEVGAIAQNMQLQGVALNVGMVLVGGFDNEQVKSLLKLPVELEPSALLCF